METCRGSIPPFWRRYELRCLRSIGLMDKALSVSPSRPRTDMWVRFPPGSCWRLRRRTHLCERPTQKHMVPRGLEPRTSRLLAERSNQLSYETSCAWSDCEAFVFLERCGLHIVARDSRAEGPRERERERERERAGGRPFFDADWLGKGHGVLPWKK